MNYRLGQRVRIQHRLVRLESTYASGAVAKQYVRQPLKGPYDGIVVGTRTLQHGRTEYIDEQPTWQPDRYERVVLVATSLSRNPYRVLPSDVMPLDEPKAQPVDDLQLSLEF